jgi:hypothetical protein
VKLEGWPLPGVGVGDPQPFLAAASLERKVGEAVTTRAEHGQILVRFPLDDVRPLLHAIAVGSGLFRREAAGVGQKLDQHCALVLTHRDAVPELHPLDGAVPPLGCFSHLADAAQ